MAELKTESVNIKVTPTVKRDLLRLVASETATTGYPVSQADVIAKLISDAAINLAIK